MGGAVGGMVSLGVRYVDDVSAVSTAETSVAVGLFATTIVRNVKRQWRRYMVTMPKMIMASIRSVAHVIHEYRWNCQKVFSDIRFCRNS